MTLLHSSTRIMTIMCVFLFAGCAARQSKLMPWPEYSSHSYRWPYFLNIYAEHGGLFYFGAKHSDNPSDEQFSDMEAVWKQFRPDIVFNEGGNPPVESTRNEAIRSQTLPSLPEW
jgi:hypothetical protein